MSYWNSFGEWLFHTEEPLTRIERLVQSVQDSSLDRLDDWCNKDNIGFHYLRNIGSRFVFIWYDYRLSSSVLKSMKWKFEYCQFNAQYYQPIFKYFLSCIPFPFKILQVRIKRHPVMYPSLVKRKCNAGFAAFLSGTERNERMSEGRGKL